MKFGCVDCKVGSYYRPMVIYIYQGDSLCDHCLKKRKEK